jgi:hypothetical protein
VSPYRMMDLFYTRGIAVARGGTKFSGWFLIF